MIINSGSELKGQLLQGNTLEGKIADDSVNGQIAGISGPKGDTGPKRR